MKKKSLLVMLILLVSLATAGAGGTSEGASAVDIGYSVPDTTNPFLGWLTGAVKEQFDADGIRVQIADAGNNPVKQVEQIENFIAMNVKVLAIMPIDPNNVQGVIQRAQKQGIKVLVAGTDTTYYDVMMNMDQYNCGEQISEMGMAWLMETFSSDGTAQGLPSGSDKLKVIVMKCTETLDMTNRSNGILDKITAWGYVDVITATAEARTTAGATAVMENMWQQNSDAVAVLCYNADGALGVNEYIMGQPGVEKSRFGVFAGDWSPPIQEVLDRSAAHESVFRGTMQIVGPKIQGKDVPLEVATYTLLKDLYEGKASYGSVIQDSIQKAYVSAQ